MDDKKIYKPYQDVCRVTGTYEDGGKTKNRYHRVGVIISTPHHSNQFMVLDSLPNAGERLQLFIRDDWQEPEAEKTASNYEKTKAIREPLNEEAVEMPDNPADFKNELNELGF